jgi:hypothetical protein
MADFQFLILLNFLNLPVTFAVSPIYSACSQSCIQAQDTTFGIPNGAIYGPVANNQAVCNNEPYLKATAQCIYQNCGEDDLSTTVGIFIAGCTETDTPTSFTSQQLIAFGSEGSSSAISVAVSTTQAPAATTAHTSVVTTGTAGTTLIGPTVSTPAPFVTTLDISPTGASSSTSNTSVSSSKKLSGGAIAGIITGAIIALALVALVLFLSLRHNRKYATAKEGPAAIDESGKPAAPDESPTDSESKKIVVAVSAIPVSSPEEYAAEPTSKNSSHDPSSGKIPVSSLPASKEHVSYPTTRGAEEMPSNNATMQDGPLMMPAELDEHSSASATVTSPHQELPAYYEPHFEMAADSTAFHAEAEDSSSHIQRANSQSPSTIGVATISTGVGAGLDIMRAPDEELAWLEAEEEKIRKRKSELIALGQRN